MAKEVSRFSGLKQLRKPPEAPTAPEPENVTSTAPVEAPRAVRGRPPGKRSNPDWTPTTMLLRKATKQAVNRKLEGGDTDLSDLVDRLLSDWLK